MDGSDARDRRPDPSFLHDGMTPRLRQVLTSVFHSLGPALLADDSSMGMEAAKVATQATQAVIQGSGQLMSKLITTVKKVGDNDLFNVDAQLPPMAGREPSASNLEVAGHQRGPSGGVGDREGSSSGRAADTEETGRPSAGVPDGKGMFGVSEMCM